MGGLDNIFEALSHPMAKWVVLAFALRALWSLMRWRVCPMAKGDFETMRDKGFAEKRGVVWRHPARFFLIMSLGIAMAIAGLFKIATYGGDAPLALLLLTAGIYLFTTEPSRRQIQQSENRLLTTTQSGDVEAMSSSQAILRGNHISLVMVEMGTAVALGAGVLALSSGMKVPM